MLHALIFTYFEHLQKCAGAMHNVCCSLVTYDGHELRGAATGWTPWKILRRAGFALFGVFNATEPNTNFAAELASTVGGDQATAIILVCNSKGDLSRPPPPNNAELWHEVYQSRSLSTFSCSPFLNVTIV